MNMVQYVNNSIDSSVSVIIFRFVFKCFNIIYRIHVNKFAYKSNGLVWNFPYVLNK